MYRHLRVRVCIRSTCLIEGPDLRQSKRTMLLVMANKYDEPSGTARVSGQCTLNVARNNTSACNETYFSTMPSTRISNTMQQRKHLLLFLILISSQILSFSRYY